MGNQYDYRQLREFINANHDRFSELNFDSSMSMQQKMNGLVEWFKVMLKEYNEWVEYLDDFKDNFDENLYRTTNNILEKWLNDGMLTDLARKLVNEEVILARKSISNIEYSNLKNRLDDEFTINSDKIIGLLGSLNILNSHVSSKIDKDGVEQIQLSNLSQEIKDIIRGSNSLPTVGENSVSTSNIVDKSVENKKLSDYYSFEPTTNVLGSSEDLNVILRNGTYYVNNSMNKPNNSSNRAVMVVSGYDLYAQQMFIDDSGSVFHRMKNGNSGWTQWSMVLNSSSLIGSNKVNTNSIIDKSVTYNKLNDNFMYNASTNTLDSTFDLNDIKKTGLYICTDTVKNIPSGANKIAILEVFSTSNSYGTQTYHDINNNVFKRINKANAPSGFTDWKQVRLETSGGDNTNTKTFVNLGDSIFYNGFSDNTDIATYIKDKTGYNGYNCAFGGTQMTTHTGAWQYLSLHRLADSIVSGDWSLQDQAMVDGVNFPTDFPAVLDRLKNIDFSKIDILTISYGTNDFSFDKKLDNTTNMYDVTTIKGSLRYSIEKILNKFPGLKIIVTTPIFKCKLDSDSVTILETSDTWVNSQNLKLTQYVTAIEEVSKTLKTPCLNMYDDLMFNKETLLCV